MHLHELVPAGGRASGRGQRRRLERFTEMEQDLPDRRRVGDEGDEADVAAAGGAREREGFGDSRDKLGPCDSRGVVGTARGIGGTLTPAPSRRERERGSVGDRQRRDGGPERVVRREDTVVAMAMPSRRGREIYQPVEKPAGREIDYAVPSGVGGLALPTGADPLAALVARE